MEKDFTQIYRNHGKLEGRTRKKIRSRERREETSAYFSLYLYIGVILSQTKRIGYVCFRNFAAECANTCTY